MSRVNVVVIEAEPIVVAITGVPVAVGGTSDFDLLENRPSYGGQVMTGQTDIPDFSTDIAAIEALIGDIADGLDAINGEVV